MTMKQHSKRLVHNTNQFLNRPIAVIIVLLLLFAYFAYGNYRFQNENRVLLENTNKTTQNTNDIVHGQTDILNAIKKLANDTKLDSNEKTNIIICMLQVPVSQRTNDLQAQCRKQVESQLTNQVTGPSFSGDSSTPTSVSPPRTPTSSATKPNPPTSVTQNPTPPSSTVKPVTPKLFNCSINLLGLHLDCSI